MRLAVLGLGQMGLAIAERLVDAGHDVAVWNRTPSPADSLKRRGATVLRRPTDAWSHGRVAFLMLADEAAVEAVVLGEGGLIEGAAGGTIVDMSTIGVDASARLAEPIAAAGAAFVRSPVSGNPSVVRAGNLGIIVSGPRDAYDAVEPPLREIGPNHFYVGDGEQARVVKLGLNLMLAGTAQLMSEALVLAERHGIGRAEMLEVIGGSAMGSPFVKYKTDALVADDYASTFTVTGLHKDLRLALECGDEAKVPLPVTAVVQQLVRGCIATGMGDLDLMALLPRMQREAGLVPENPS